MKMKIKITGNQLIGNTIVNEGKNKFFAVNPQTMQLLQPAFYDASINEVNNALCLASEAFPLYRKKTPEQRAVFLEAIADNIIALDDILIKRCMQETALTEVRLIGERGRTVKQLRMFASVLREGSWVEASIDTAIPERKSVPKPDLRRMLRPLGVVAVFGASNFPLAYSVAGGDTASALAAGCPVVVKAHSAHPGASELVGRAIMKAIYDTGMPEGTFSLLHGESYEVGKALVEHPSVKAVGFTGSYKGGRALSDLAAAREEPIPVYAEMGSVNPVFILPDALKERKEEIASELAASITLGVGQFCTNPGLFIIEDSPDADDFIKLLAEHLQEAKGGCMLTENIKKNYTNGTKRFLSVDGVVQLTKNRTGDVDVCEANPVLFKLTAQCFMKHPLFGEEVFGPSSLAVVAKDGLEVMKLANSLKGHLTASVMATEVDLICFAELFSVLENKAGRLIFNGYPTGVEVCCSMHHGGPHPASSDRRSTSVGAMAIKRFANPVCYQDFSQSLLPPELKDENPMGIWRMVNDKFQV